VKLRDSSNHGWNRERSKELATLRRAFHGDRMAEVDVHYTDKECEELFAGLFPDGFAGEDVLTEIAPEGWEQSMLRFVFHPTLDQVHWEAVRLHRNLQSWPRRDNKVLDDPEPTREEVAATYEDHPIEVHREVRELVGKCLWDIFSDGHDVLGPDNRVVHIGSFRGAGAFISEQLNRQTGERKYDYLDFYMGTIWVSQRADLSPVYQMIFRRLKERLLSWRYRFPKLSLIEFGPPDRLDGGARLEVENLKAELKEIHREAIKEARQEPEPATVFAYQEVYGSFPTGWPPSESDDD
jgi:hypothetical protein